MKALLISIHPQWVELILNFIKKDEIRKGTAIGKAINRLIKEQGVAPMLIYCTKKYDECLWYKKDSQRYVLNYGKPTNDYLNGKVVARFNATAEEINTINLDKFAKDSCLTIRELEEYLWSNILSGTAIHINDLEIFDKPKEISEFKYYKKFSEIDYMLPIPRKETCERLVALTRAPQSWCYVEI